MVTQRHALLGKEGQKQGVSLSLKEGGGQIEYEDQDPRIHRLWLEEMKKNNVTPRMEHLIPSVSPKAVSA
jgi:hypothetical protein